MTVTALFWQAPTVIEYGGWMITNHLEKHLYELPCVDLQTTNPVMRYGFFKANGWKHLPKDEFPPEFRMALLLWE